MKSIIKKNILKKMMASVLSLSLVIGLSGSVFGASHAANGANVIPSGAHWSGFSICTREDGGSWEDSLKKVYRTNSDGTYFLDADGQKVTFVKGVDYATEGWISGDYNNTGSEVTFFAVSTGWDGEYASMTRNGPSELVGDNPWGMTMTLTGIPVELGRYYTVEFDIAGDLKQIFYNNITKETTYTPADKHILLKAYDFNSRGEPSASFEKVEQDGTEISKDGYIEIAKTPEGQDLKFSHVVCRLKIPESADDWGGGKNKGIFTEAGLKFAMGANLVTYPDEGSMTGNIHIKNMNMSAGKQYAVRYYDGNTYKTSRYVNEDESAISAKIAKPKYSLFGYTNIATGKKYNFADTVNSDLNLRAIWQKTQAPKKAKIKVKCNKKHRETVTFGSNSNVQGYQVMYSYSSKFKKKSKFKTKTKNTSNTSEYTIKSLRSGAVVYVKSRAYNLDSANKKVFGKWSSRKVAYVK